ncbi:cyclic nucleotide-binding protein [Lentibacillus cibarius]|uniref:Cyclic nucleotide-binding protein n=1 Tax=Lentibacillus cibarius TaxID=2583219 RepID=A0A549YGA2_9BACI|nr:DmsC/YnfH family molybdoenzyme membrane anchor subunit [Lentibacillus cibarius]TMN22144.1 cyclic nucleotide-binding protein [Lentibacillus cibarius]TRM10920.1 cyclic nucleotide-binding protein [Lentibacillus cibarius]
MHEWPLLVFTISIQTAIGGIFMLWIFQLINRKRNLDTASLFKIPLIVIGVLSLVGLGASFAHLGAPINALNTIRHVGSSWMSREILVTGTFIGLAVLNTAWVLYRKQILPWLLITTTVVGFVDVYCMAAIYTKSLIGPWNSINTFMSFYGTTLILGAVLAVALLTPKLYKQKLELVAKQFLKTTLIITLSGFGLHIIGTALFSPEALETTIVGSSMAASVIATYKVMVATRWIISILGVALLGYLTLSSYKKSFTSLTFLTLAVFVLSEGMSRYVFYLLGS